MKLELTVDPERGKRMKAIRKHMKKTLGDVNDETGISRSYLSDFERGTKLPTGKYIKYLYDNWNIDTNYIFDGSGEMLRTSGNKEFDFGKYQEDVDEMLSLMSELDHTLYAMLGYFSEYQMKYADLIREFSQKKAGAEK